MTPRCCWCSGRAPATRRADRRASGSEYAREVCTFVREGLSSAEPVLVAVPGRHLDLALGALGEAAGAVSFADIAILGRNPARIISAIRRFTDSRRPGRSRF